MPIDLLHNTGFASTTNGPVSTDNDGADSAASTTGSDDKTSGKKRAALDPNSAAFAQLLLARAKIKQDFESSVAKDGVEGADKPKTTPKNKLTQNPYALSPETLRQVATSVHANVVLPPPAAHIRPPTAQQAQAFAKHAAMRSPAAATGGAAAASVTAAELINTIDSHAITDSFTPQEAAYIKQLVGKAPPAAVVAASADSDPSATINPVAAVKNSDSISSIQKAAMTFVSWQTFCAALAIKQQNVLAIWLLQRQKLQHLVAVTSILMLKTDKILQANQISMETAIMGLGLMRAVESAKNSWTIGMMNPLKNSTASTMRSDADLAADPNIREDRAPSQDLNRIALIHKAATGEIPTSNAAFHRYTDMLAGKSAGKEASHQQGVSFVHMPASDSPADAENMVVLGRSLLSKSEVAGLARTPKLQAAYLESMSEFHKQRGNDYGATVGLYDHEIALCRGAQTRWAKIAAASEQGPLSAQATQHAETWKTRAQDLEDESEPYRFRMQYRSSMVLEDENRYGDMLRQRHDLEQKRQGIKTQLANPSEDLTPALKDHLARVKMNMDWRAIALDQQLGRHTNPNDDARFTRWHTGARDMADGFLLAFSEHADPKGADPSLRLNTMTAIAPTGAAAVNEQYIKSVQRASAGAAEQPNQDDLKNISREQMLRHIEDRRKALEHKDPEDTNAQVKAFHEQERLAIGTISAPRKDGVVERYWAQEAPYSKQIKPTQLWVPRTWSLNPLRPDPTLFQQGFMAHNLKKPTEVVQQNPRGGQEPKNAEKRTNNFLRMASVGTPPNGADEQAMRAYYDTKAEAGAAVMGRSHEKDSSAYQNPLFEKLNPLIDAGQYIDFSAMDNAATEAAMSNTQDVAADAAGKLSEAFAEMNQERQMIQGMISQLIDQTYKMPT